MKKLVLMAVFTAIFFSIKAQVQITGTVLDANTSEPIAAEIKVGGKILYTGSSGAFSVLIPDSIKFIIIQATEYSTLTYAIDKISSETTEFFLESSNMAMQAVQITASIASKDRKTPVVYTNVSGKDIKANLGSADLPTLFNNTPGVYATQQGGGAGDARITIRGFNQRNIAVMVDGIPVNDMENGQVYWSNWFGLSEVTKFTQIQRGLGSSRLANPSVGGTINIITKGFSKKFGAGASIEMGDANYKQYSAFINTGKLPGNWGGVFAVTHRSSDGYVDGLYDQMYSFFGKIEKRFGHKINLSLTYIGAPQEHGQRSFKARLPLYSQSLAKSTGLDTNINSMVVDKGRRYNQHMGLLDRTKLVDGKRVSNGQELINERLNAFHKPQVYLKMDWKPASQIINSAILYASVGRGGGVVGEGLRQDPSLYGYYSMQAAYDQNRYGSAFVKPVDPAYDPTLRKSTAILARNINNHNWVGFLNTLNYKIDKQNTVTGGIDLRSYEGEHYKVVHDLLGGEYYRPTARDTLPGAKSRLYKEDDKYGFLYYGKVRWAGVFGEYEHATDKLSTFLNVSASNSWYQRVDYFRPDANGNPGKTDWLNILGGTLKTGLGYNLSQKVNVFGNLGYLNRPARFNNAFDRSNKITRDLKNEIVMGGELGAKYQSPLFSVDANVYYTNWNNRPLDFLPSFTTLDGDVFSYNITGLRAVHMGAELKAVYKVSKAFTVQTAIALGDWRWKSAANAMVLDDNDDSVATVAFDATNVHVGDAAQNQFVLNLKYEAKKGFLRGTYMSAEAIYFGKNFAQFEPTALTAGYERRESFQIPNYYTINISGGYSFKHSDNKVSIFFNVRNLTDLLYISDADHRLNRSDIPGTFNPRNLEVFVSPGRRITGGISIEF